MQHDTQICDWFNSVSNGNPGTSKANSIRKELGFIELFTAENHQLLGTIGF